MSNPYQPPQSQPNGQPQQPTGGYTPPQGGSSAAPQPGSYSAPQGGSYSAPQGQPYANQAYSAPQGQPYAAGAPEYGSPQYQAQQQAYPQYGQMAPGYPGGGVQVGRTAGAGIRLLAYIIDGLILGIPIGIIQSFLPHDVMVIGDQYLETPGTLARFVAFVIALAYYGYFYGQGQTLGKKFLGLKVVDAETGGPIGTGRGVLRYFVLWLMTIPLLLGWLSVPFSSDKRGFHDRAAKDRVIKL